MPRALWTGALSFGLVSIPVEIHTAVRDKGPRFRLLRRSDRSPVRYQRVAERDGDIVDWDQIVRGFEYEKGRFIVLTEEDFEQAAVRKDRAIDILDFVDGSAIDDRYFEKPYYLLPGRGGADAYALLREAIRESGQLGIAKFVLRNRQRLAAVEAIGDALVLSTMRFRDELVPLEDYEFPAADAARKRDLQLARRLIDEFTSDWDADKYTDDYRRNIMAIIDARRKRVKPTLELEGEKQSAQVVDLMERLRQSLGTRRAEGSRARGSKPAPRKAAGKARRAGVKKTATRAAGRRSRRNAA